MSEIHVWTDTSTELLRHYWETEKLSGSEIAKKLGLTKNAVIGKVRRLKLSKRGARTKRIRPPKKARPMHVINTPAPAPIHSIDEHRRGAGPVRQFDERGVDGEKPSRTEDSCQYLTEHTDKRGKIRQIPCGKPCVHIAGRRKSYCRQHYELCCIPPKKPGET